MATPTETLEAFIVAFEVIYSAPDFSTVTAGTDDGDVYIRRNPPSPPNGG